MPIEEIIRLIQRTLNNSYKVLDPSFGINKTEMKSLIDSYKTDKYGLTVDRTSLTTVAIGLMLLDKEKNYSLEQIMDQEQLNDEKLQYGAKAVELFKNKDFDSMAKAYAAASRVSSQYMEEHRIKDMKPVDLLRDDMQYYLCAMTIFNDANQELGWSYTDKDGKMQKQERLYNLSGMTPEEIKTATNQCLAWGQAIRHYNTLLEAICKIAENKDPSHLSLILQSPLSNYGKVLNTEYLISSGKIGTMSSNDVSNSFTDATLADNSVQMSLTVELGDWAKVINDAFLEVLTDKRQRLILINQLLDRSFQNKIYKTENNKITAADPETIVAAFKSIESIVKEEAEFILSQADSKISEFEKEKAQQTDQAGFEAVLRDSQIYSYDKLTDLVGREEPELAYVKEHFAVVLFAEQYLNDPDTDKTPEAYSRFISRAAGSKAVADLVSGDPARTLEFAITKEADSEELTQLYDGLNEEIKALGEDNSIAKEEKDTINNVLLNFKGRLIRNLGPRDNKDLQNPSAYRKLMDKIDSVFDDFQKSWDRPEIHSKLDELADEAFAYYTEKADQSMTKTRPERMKIAQDIMAFADAVKRGDNTEIFEPRPLNANKENEINLKAAEKKLNDENLRKLIAARAVKTQLLKMIKEGKQPQKERAEDILKNREKFEVQIKDLRFSKQFRAIFDDPRMTAEALEKTLKNSGSKIVDALTKKKKDLDKTPLDLKAEIDKAATLEPNTDTMKEAFFGKYMKENGIEKGKTKDDKWTPLKESFKFNRGLKTDRSALVTLALCNMLNKGFDFENIMDMDILQDERDRSFSEVAKLMNEDSPEASEKIAGIYADGIEKLNNRLCKLVDSADPSDPKCFWNKKTCTAKRLGNYLQDAMQELERVGLKEYAHKIYKGAENFKKEHTKVLGLINYVNTVSAGTETAVMLANRKDRNGFNSISDGNFLKTVVASKGIRQLMAENMKRSPKMKPSAIACTINSDLASTILSAGIMTEGSQSINRSLSTIETGKALGEAVLSGKFDKNYKIKFDEHGECSITGLDEAAKPFEPLGSEIFAAKF